MDSTQKVSKMEDQPEFDEILNDLFDGLYVVDPDRRVVFWNQGAEEITGYNQEEMIGSHCFRNLLIHVDKDGNRLCNKGCPMQHTLDTGQRQSTTLYVKHKEGHRVQIKATVGPIRNKEGKVIQAYQVFDDSLSSAELKEEVKELSRIALYDPLTELGNRRFAEETLNLFFNEFARLGRTFGILFVDIDHFKSVNDTYGHDSGDRVLKMVASNLIVNLRSYDAICRWGGEEFIALIKCHNADQLENIGNKLRVLVANSALDLGDKELSVTASFGGSMVRLGDSHESLIARADEHMYKAKELGRNRVVVE